tara:strand:+ start:36087 stop:36776 length:690 start_codon:yes stop_codon:yes gene_type:complete
LPFPTAVMLGNHDRGYDKTGEILKKKFLLLGQTNIAWNLIEWPNFPISIVGARPCSPGGGFYLASELSGVFGDISLEESSRRIVEAAKSASIEKPLVMLSHSGPYGLGDGAESICGRDWKKPYLDWGDHDLSIAIKTIRKFKNPDLVVFGHMHHSLRNNSSFRKTFQKDHFGTLFLNAAVVPRESIDPMGDKVSHFSWVEFYKRKIIHVSHRWYKKDGTLYYIEHLFDI